MAIIQGRWIQWIAATMLLGPILAVSVVSSAADAEDWRQFRGPSGASSIDAELGIDVSTPDALAWKSPLPGQGVSSPIVIGNRVFVTCSGGMEERVISLVCLDATTGNQLWHRSCWATGRPFCHPASANAAPTPCSDGKHVVAFYSSNDVACFDLDGNFCWYRGLSHDYPKAANDVGMSSSPIAVGDKVICQVENQGDSFVEALKISDGTTAWRIERPKKPNWSSPIYVGGHAGFTEFVVLQSLDSLDGINPETGSLLWSLGKPCDIISSSVFADGILYAPVDGLTAFEVSAEDGPEVLWESAKLRPSNASVIVHDGTVYSLNRSGVLVAADPRSGEQRWKHRVGGSYWATPVAAGHHMYFFSQNGDVRVADLSKEGEVVSELSLDESIYGSPAVAGNAVYVRSDDHLWKFEKSTHERQVQP